MANSDFNRLSSAVSKLFGNYKELRQSLDVLWEMVVNKRKVDIAIDQASKINVLRTTTGDNLQSYLEFLEKMTTKESRTNFEELEFQANLAKDTMEGLAKELNVDKLPKDPEGEADNLRNDDENQHFARTVKNGQQRMEGADDLVKVIAEKLLGRIKKELKEAFKDEDLFTDDKTLAGKIEEVRAKIEAFFLTREKNIAILEGIISKKSLPTEEDAETLEEACKRNKEE